MNPKVIFYSWQSDLNKIYNNYFIRDCIQGALKELKRDLKIELSLDKDTQKTPGAPDIVETILKKIRLADIFICDVTIVNKNLMNKWLRSRKMPNPNVMLELGYAIKTLGWDRIICVANTNYCTIDDLPFDIRKNRISTYNLNGKNGVKKAKADLVNTFKLALKLIIDNYPSILETLEKDNFLLHDKALFEKFDSLVKQQAFEESLLFVVNNLKINRHYYKLWDKISHFVDAHQNHFLNVDVQQKIETLSVLTKELKLFVATKFSPIKTPGQRYESDYEEKGIGITAEIQFEIDCSQIFSYPTEPKDQNWEVFDERRHDVIKQLNNYIDNLIASYMHFRLTVKKELLI